MPKDAQALLTLLNQTSADQGMWQYRSMYVVVIVDSSSNSRHATPVLPRLHILEAVNSFFKVGYLHKEWWWYLGPERAPVIKC